MKRAELKLKRTKRTIRIKGENGFALRLDLDVASTTLAREEFSHLVEVVTDSITKALVPNGVPFHNLHFSGVEISR